MVGTSYECPNACFCALEQDFLIPWVQQQHFEIRLNFRYILTSWKGGSAGVSYCYLLHGKLSKRIAERRKKNKLVNAKQRVYFYDQAVPGGRQAFPQVHITRSTGCFRASSLPGLFLISIKCNSNFPINKRFPQAKETGGNT